MDIGLTKIGRGKPSLLLLPLKEFETLRFHLNHQEEFYRINVDCFFAYVIDGTTSPGVDEIQFKVEIRALSYGDDDKIKTEAIDGAADGVKELQVPSSD